MAQARISPAWRDLVGVAALVLTFGALAIHFELSERVAQRLQAHERLQLDELALTLLVLSLCLAWFARKRMREVSALLAVNRDLTQRLLTAQEDERRTLAQELHDEVGQVCTALRIEAAYLGQTITTQPAQAVAAAQRIDQSAVRMHSLARDMLKRLRPPNLDSMGLIASITALCQHWQQHGGLPCHTLFDDVPTQLPDQLCTHLYRVVQEALTNISKHAHATQAWVGLHISDEVLTLSITDNGQGLQANATTQGLGLGGMRERVASLHGRLHFENAQPGLRIHVQVPLTGVPA